MGSRWQWSIILKVVGKLDKCQTTTKPNKTRTVCIFLGIYSMCWPPVGGLSRFRSVLWPQNQLTRNSGMYYFTSLVYNYVACTNSYEYGVRDHYNRKLFIVINVLRPEINFLQWKLLYFDSKLKICSQRCFWYYQSIMACRLAWPYGITRPRWVKSYTIAYRCRPATAAVYLIKHALLLYLTLLCMMMSSNGDIFYVTGPLCGESTG